MELCRLQMHRRSLPPVNKWKLVYDGNISLIVTLLPYRHNVIEMPIYFPLHIDLGYIWLQKISQTSIKIKVWMNNCIDIKCKMEFAHAYTAKAVSRRCNEVIDKLLHATQNYFI